MAGAHAHEDHDHAHAGPHHHGLSARSASKLPPRERAAERRSLSLALALTVVVMVAEAVGGWLTGSLSLQADAGHMLTDASALGLALLALWFASKPADPKATYGYYRLEILAALANGVTLLLLALYIGWEAVERLRDPQPIRAGTMLVVAGIGLATNLLGILLLKGRGHSLAVKGAYLHLLGDTLSSVGVVAAGAVVWFTGFTAADAVVSVLIALVVVYGAIRLVREAVDVLLEAVPAHLDLAEVLHAMEHVEGVTAVHDLHIWTISSGMHALSAHVVVGGCDLGKNDEILRRVKGELHEQFGIDHVTLQIETPAYCRDVPVAH